MFGSYSYSGSRPAKPAVVYKRLGDYNIFNTRVIFDIPATVIRSTTADVVNQVSRNDKKSIAKAAEFLTLRNEAFSARSEWLEKANALNFHGGVNGGDLGRAMRAFYAKRMEYKNKLLAMASNGIWNCMEFADFACITISEQVLDMPRGSTVGVVSLNDPQIPESEYYTYFQLLTQEQRNLLQERNHDHAFVAVFDEYRRPVHIIDLWQHLINKEGSPFMGSCDEFIQLLNDNKDGRYVTRNVDRTHIREYVDTRLAGGYSEGSSGYSLVYPRR